MRFPFSAAVFLVTAATLCAQPYATKPLAPDKMDYDTWRTRPAGAKTVRVSFRYVSAPHDNAMAWAKPDFPLFNGTNLFLYPEGLPLDFASTVTVHTEGAWHVATGMARAPQSQSPSQSQSHAYTYSAASGLAIPNLVSTIGVYVFAIGIFVSLWNLIHSLRVGEVAVNNPWGAASLEWLAASPPEHFNFAHIPVVHSREPAMSHGPITIALFCTKPSSVLKGSSALRSFAAESPHQ